VRRRGCWECFQKYPYRIFFPEWHTPCFHCLKSDPHSRKALKQPPQYSGQEDIVIGSPFENRTLSELTNIIGMFVNNIIIREKVSPSLTYMDFINDIRTNCLATFNNADLPFEEILKAIDYKGNANNSSIFNTMFIFQNKGIPEIKLDNTIGKVIKYDNKTSKFNLSLEVIPTNGTYSLNFEYKTTLFKEATIKRMSSRFKKHN